jgi:hypothetical protein
VSHHHIKDYRAIIAPIALNINTRRSDSKVMTFRINGLGNKSVRFKGRTKINKITPGTPHIILSSQIGALASYMSSFMSGYKNPSFYEYDLDGDDTYIMDGGLGKPIGLIDMYDVPGNVTTPWLIAGTNYSAGSFSLETYVDRISYANTTATTVDTDFIYASVSGYTQLGTTRPLMVIGTRSGTGNPIGWQKGGNSGADGTGTLASGFIYNGTTLNGFTVYSYIRQTYNASPADPSHCDLYILLGHPNWGTTFGTISSYADPVDVGGCGGYLHTTGAGVKNVLAITTLLSKQNGVQVTTAECQTVIDNIVNRVGIYFGYIVAPLASVTPSTTNVNEGSSVTFNVISDQLSSTLYWDLNQVSGTINASDFVGAATTGSFTTNGSGVGSITLTLSNDLTTEGTDSFQLQVRTGSTNGSISTTSSTITINDTSLSPPTYSITPSSTSLSEAPGATCTFTINTTNVTPGTTLFYGISGTNITSGDFTDNTLTGSYTISGTFANGTASFTKTIQSDATFEDDETFTATVRTSDGGTIVATSVDITIVDTVYAGGCGSSQTLLAANHSDFTFSATSYTIEFFVKNPNGSELFSLRKDSNASLATFLKYSGGAGQLEYRVLTGPSAPVSATFSASGLTVSNTWIHVALSYNSSTTVLSCYVNGTRVTTNTNSSWGNYSFTTLANGFNFFGLNGGSVDGTTSISNTSTSGFSNFRFIVGTALYSGTTITVPAVPLTAVTGTKLLLLNGQSSTITKDNSGTNKTITSIGTLFKIEGPTATGFAVATGTKAPVLGSGPVATLAYPASGWSSLQNAYADDNFVQVNLPFNFTIDSTAFTSVFPSSNCYLTFGSGSTEYTNLGPSVPAIPKIMYGAGDLCHQRVSSITSGTDYVRIRQESFNSNSNSGAPIPPGDSNLIFEITIFNPSKFGGQNVVELLVGNWIINSVYNFSNISNASTAYTTYSISASQSYVFVGNSTGTSWTVNTGSFVSGTNY